MNETQRQEYLKTMGIQSYFPRVVLPGAKPSPEYDFDEPALVSAGPLTNSPLTIQPEERSPERAPERGGSAGSADNSALNDIRAAASASRREASKPNREASKPNREASKPDRKPSKPESGATDPVSKPAGEVKTNTEKLDMADSTAEGADLRFSLNYYKITPTLALVNEVPHQNAANQDAQIMALMKAILLALSVDVETSALRTENFSWPLSSDLDLESGSSELAAKAVSGFLQMRQHKDQFSDLLVFAGRSEELIQGEDSNSQDFKSACGSFNLTVTKSLHSMLVHPALKKEVWQDLQPLRRRLSKSE